MSDQTDNVERLAEPRRIQLKRTKGWRMPENTVKVDRSTKWGNPFCGADYPTREKQVFRFRAAVLGNEFVGYNPNPHPESYIGRIIADAPKELRGKNLACWCPLDGPCHADVLLELANAPAARSASTGEG